MAPVVVTTDCGRFALGTSGRVRYLGRRRLPVPQDVVWYPDLSWYRLDRGRLVVGRGRRTLWRSSGRFGSRYGMGALALSPTRIAFSYARRPDDWKRPVLYLARRGGAEWPVARGETPLGWTAAGRLLTWGGSGTVRVRDGGGRLLRTLAHGVHTFVFDRPSKTLFFLAQGRLFRFDGRGLGTLVRLKSVGLGAPVTIEPFDGFVTVRGVHRLLVVRAGGGVVSSMRLPHLPLRTDTVSAVAVDSAGELAFTATRGNTAYGSTGVETVYLLDPGASRARPLYRERVEFAVCERAAALSWRGRFLLYSNSEGNAAVVATSGRRATIDLSRTTRELPGLENKSFQASWVGSARPT